MHALHASAGQDTTHDQLCSELSEFFNDLIINLDGAKLQFHGLRFPKEHPECVAIDLKICVDKFPNPVTITF